MKPALTGVGAAQGQKRKKPASITCGLDVDCGGNSGRGSSPTQKARHSLERGLCFLAAIPAQAGDIRVFAPKKPAILANAGTLI